MIHPDEVAKLICALAKEHGYCVRTLDMMKAESFMQDLPRYSYGFDYVVSADVEGNRIATNA